MDEWQERRPELRVWTVGEEFFCPQVALSGKPPELVLTHLSDAPRWGTNFGKAYPCRALHGHNVGGDVELWPLHSWSRANGW